ncbi:MAG: hypothetical protein IH588_09835 [Anaerolineales bacterium]|nr:hypothetical protein [Anaerolineales bacterium]
MKNKRLVYILLVLVVTSCLPVPTSTPPPTIAAPVMIQVEENPYRPQTSDVSLKLAGAIINSTNLIERFDLDPFRVEVIISGSVPSVCNELRINVAPPNKDYQIYIEVYSLVNTDINCDNVFQQFEASLLLGVYSNGRYTVWVNEGFAGDFITY